ncbi:urease accessory protein UreD [Mycolicibacterium novocastrense]|uniref:Urease accessory protein UreD n=1 Tax=Mycolicibacterium novocastrense TaxID=59813 RepID=A0AAW5SSU3_MYCNV|nr:urease accessory protein UreD [Mycolicibacterium novocastrense]MCV7026808.1 urease accessory protein UreD [Mycolicibacterium novocastrense]GAT10644.1 urease accessory protein ureD [Mycolicibacterium novocastrense]
MRSEVLIVARRDRRPRIECAGGLAARLTGPDTVHLVSAAATPLGGDVLHFRVVVEPDARLRIRTAAATMALPGTKTPESHAIWELDVAGLLDLDPEPTIVAADSRHHSSVRLDLGACGRVRIRERVQIGRSDERDGFWSGSLHADVDGAPLLRHRIELGRGSVTDDEIGAPMAAISELSYPDADVDTTGEPLALAAGGCLATWQGARL